MAKPRKNRSRSGADTVCPDCGKKLRGTKGLKAHRAAEHEAGPGDDVFNPHGSGPVPVEERSS